MPVTRGQAADPVPAPPNAPTYSLFSVDSSTKVTIQYTIGPFANNRFPVSAGQPSDDSQLAINSATIIGMPANANISLVITFGKANVQFQPPIPINGLTWNQSKGQYTAASPQLKDLAKGLVDAINGMLGGFDADHAIPPTKATLTISPQFANQDPKNPPFSVDGVVEITFQPVATFAAASPKPPTVDEQQATVAQEQATTTQEHAITAQQQADMTAQQVTIAQQQMACAQQQAAIAQEQAAARAGKPQPAAVVQRQKATARQQVAVSQEQVAVAQQQVAETQREVAVAQRQVAVAKQHLALATQLLATAQPAQKIIAQQQATVAQQQSDLAQRQSDVAQKLNSVAQAQSDVAQRQNAQAQQQDAAAR